jgi:nicotinate-nucleotide adenylyltransferase
MKKRIGIYSGTFDPVHNGHIGFALRALDVAKLDEVVLIPEKRPREKDTVTDLTHRFELLVRATEPYEGLAVRLLSPEQFCVQGTLPELRAMYGGDTELHMLLGSDVVKTFPSRWTNLDDLFTHMGLVIGLRRGDTRKELKKLLKGLDTKVSPRYTFVDSPLNAANSTRVRSGAVVRDIAPEVSEYIEQHKLYGAR